MIRRADDTSTIYLKSGCFLPDNFTIFRGKAMKFANEDSNSFVIQCKGSFGIPSFRLEAKGSHTINFPKTGKFQFTSAANTTLKCIIEVLEQETKKELPPFLLYGSLGNYAESILAKKKEYENLNQLRKNRVNVTFSPAQDKEEELEEVNHIRTQRELFKHYKSSVPFASIANSSASDQNILRVENELEVQLETGFVFESENHIVWIEDFDFAEHVITAYVGDTISFVLSPSVPLHAEHIIYGESDNELLNFESDILQVSDCSRFEFKVTASGEINVSCKIYHEMHCIIDVKPNTRRLKPLSMDESGITAVALISETSMDSRTHSAHSISSESFYDSDDVLSEVEHIDGGQMEEDEDDEIDVHHMVSIGDHFHLDQFGEDTDYIGDLDLVDILDAASLEDFIINIDADSFRPDKVDCVSNAMVKFVLDPNYPSCTISCDGEFYGILLNKYQSTYRHQFQKAGVFEVYNETFNFICCRVDVRGEAAVGENVSLEQPTSATLHSSIIESGNMHSLKYPTSQMLCEEEPTQFRLFGSFISTKPINSAPPQVPFATEDTGEFATVPLGYDKGLTSISELTLDEQECLQVLQDCLAYDGMENLSRAAKKRLKYKQRIKLKKSQQGQQQEFGDSQDSPVTSNTMKSVINTSVSEIIETDVSTASNGKKKKKQKSAIHRASNQLNHETAVCPLAEKDATKDNSNNIIHGKVPTSSSLPVSNPPLTLSSSLLSEINAGNQHLDSSKPPTRSSKSDKRHLYSPDRKSSSTSSSIVSSPLSNAKYAFAVADWTEDIEIVSDSDDSSALTSSSVVKIDAPVEKSTTTADMIPIQVDGFEETKNEVADVAIVIENSTSMDENIPPKVLQDSPDAKDRSIACSNTEENDSLIQNTVLEVNIAILGASEEDSFGESSSSDSGSLCLIGVEDDRWMLTDEDDSDNSDYDDAELRNNFVEPIAAEVSVGTNNINETDLSLLSTNSQSSAAAPADSSVVLSKRGLLFSVLGLSNANLKDSDVIHSAVAPTVSQENSFEENNDTDNMDIVLQENESGKQCECAESSMSDEDSMGDFCGEEEVGPGISEDDNAWQRRWEHQQEFMNIFTQRVEELTRKAKLQMTDKLPSGKNVGVYIWEELPTKSMKATSERDVTHQMAPPGLSAKHTHNAPVDVAVVLEQKVSSVFSDTAPLAVEVLVDRPTTLAPVMNVHQQIEDVVLSDTVTPETKILKSNKSVKKEVVREVSSVTKKKRKPSIGITCEPTAAEAGIAAPLPPSPFPLSHPLPTSAEKQKKKNKKSHPRDKRHAPLDRVPDNSSSLLQFTTASDDITDNNKKESLSSTVTTISPHLPEERHTKNAVQSATQRPSLKKPLLPDPSTNTVASETTTLLPGPSVLSKKVKMPSVPVVSRPVCTTVTTTVTAPAVTRMVTSVSVTASPAISFVGSKPSLALTSLSSSTTSSTLPNNSDVVDVDIKDNMTQAKSVLLKNVRKRHEKKKKSSESQN